MNMPQSPFLTLVEAAEYLRYTSPSAVSAMWKFVKRTGLPIYRRGGRVMLVRREDLDEYLATGRCERGRARRLREAQRAK